MELDLDAVVAAFEARPTTLARRERTAVTSEDVSISEQVPVDFATRNFAAYEELVDSDGRVAVPLHKADCAELTGEYVLYSDASLYPVYAYYDTQSEQRARISADRIQGTVFAWQLRFWTDEYDPPSIPPYTADQDAIATTAPAVVQPQHDYSESDASAFYDRLQSFVTDMERAERDENRAAYANLSYGAYRRRFGGVPVAIPIRYVETEEGAYCTVIVPDEVLDEDITSDFDLYPESEVLIDAQTHDSNSVSQRTIDQFPVEGVVTEIEGNTLQVKLGPDRNATASMDALGEIFADEAGALRIASLHNPVPANRKLAGIRATRERPAKRAVITGNDPLLFDPTRVSATFEDLNEYQTRAATRALAADHVACIHGPPGTGKTRTLVALLKHCVDNGLQVLACAHSNQATDNLLVGTSTPGSPDPGSLHAAAEAGDLTIARAGSGTTNPVVAREYDTRSVGDADVVGATLSATAAFDADTFDVAVIDEASQASIPASLLPLVAAERVVLAGDHRQLPPYASTELETREMEVSLFEHLLDRYGDDVAVTLRKQYRMHRDIAAFPNEQFYDGALETAGEARQRRIPGLDPVVAYDVTGPEEPAQGNSWRNEREAHLVATEIQRLLEHDVSPGAIGVITPYRGQIGAIRAAVDGLSRDAAPIKIDTIDSFQGGERDAIVVSFVRSNTAGTTGFLTLPDEGPRRLNVALTRARKRLTLIGDWDTLCADETGENCVETYRDLRSWLQAERAFRPAPKQVP